MLLLVECNILWYKWRLILPTNVIVLNPYGAWCWESICISSYSLVLQYFQLLQWKQLSDIPCCRNFKSVFLVKHFTSWVPVNVCDIARCTFTNAHSFAGKYIVNVYKIIMGSHSKVLSCFCKEETLRLWKIYIVMHFYYSSAPKSFN